jgi:hypothetical protein
MHAVLAMRIEAQKKQPVHTSQSLFESFDMSKDIPKGATMMSRNGKATENLYKNLR